MNKIQLWLSTKEGFTIRAYTIGDSVPKYLFFAGRAFILISDGQTRFNNYDEITDFTSLVFIDESDE
jgi:hypothetical protein